eukprot:scaffold9619_cov108-Skeletonema_dohrnii-CCMP3373.AAC.1
MFCTQPRIRNCVLTLSFLLLLVTGNRSRRQPSITTMSLLSKPEQVEHVLSNLFSDHPDIVAAVKIATWTTVPKLMKADMNTIRALKNKNGSELSTVLTSEQLEVLKAGISYINYRQIEYGELRVEGQFDIHDGVNAQALRDWIDDAEEYVKYTAALARARATERAEKKTMEEQAALRKQVLEAELQAAQQAQSNATILGAGSGGSSGSGGGNQGLSSSSGGNQGLKPDTIIEKMPELNDKVNYKTWSAQVATLAKAASCGD